MFHSCTPAPNNARSKEVQAPAKLKDEDYGEKKAHRGRIDWSPGKCFAFPLKVDCVYIIPGSWEAPDKTRFCLLFFPHAVSLIGI
jgi:hypothetical protein